MKQKIENFGASALMLGKKYAPTVLLLLLSIAVRAQDGAEEITNVWKDEIQPIVNTVLTIAFFLGLVWFVIALSMGKKQAMQIGGYIMLGAFVFRVLPSILEAITGLDFGTLVGTN
jgi:hypothetical protein